MPKIVITHKVVDVERWLKLRRSGPTPSRHSAPA
jgi:hypothetical protein